MIGSKTIPLSHKDTIPNGRKAVKFKNIRMVVFRKVNPIYNHRGYAYKEVSGLLHRISHEEKLQLSVQELKLRGGIFTTSS